MKNKKMDSSTVLAIIVIVIIASLLLLGFCTITTMFVAGEIGTVRTEKYLGSIKKQENSQHFLHLCGGEKEGNVNARLMIDMLLNTPTNWLDCNYFGATDKELFYYIETDEGIQFYKSNYIDYKYEMTRSFNSDEILYHKCDKLIYLGEDGETYIFDGFELTDEIYEGEIPTYTPKYTVTKEKKDFVIKYNETGEEKSISDLKKTFGQNEHVKKLGWFKSIDYVFAHGDNVYVVYSVYGLAVVFELDFENETLTLKNWAEVIYGRKSSKTWYLDRVKFAE